MARKPAETLEKSRLVVGISGASGVAYGIRLLEALRELSVESHLVMSKAAEMTIGYETALKSKEVAAKADHVYPVGDIGARTSTSRVLRVRNARSIPIS